MIMIIINCIEAGIFSLTETSLKMSYPIDESFKNKKLEES